MHTIQIIHAQIHELQVPQVLPWTVDASNGLGLSGGIGLCAAAGPGRGISVLGVRGVCVGRATDLGAHQMVRP